MALPLTMRRGEARLRSLRAIVRDTQRALSDVADIIALEAEISSSVFDIGSKASRPLAIVVLGRNCASRARFVNCLLGQNVLPTDDHRGWKWITFQYGNSKQAHLTLGNSEFELVEDLECNKRYWDVVPIEDLKRKDETDLSTILDIELNNQFLKEGVKIIIPPDLDSQPNPNNNLYELKNIYTEFYTKRQLILKHFNSIFFYALDSIGKNVFSENFCDNKNHEKSTSSHEKSKNDEDFWKTYNMYYMSRAPEKCDNSDKNSLNKLSGNNEVSDEQAGVSDDRNRTKYVHDSLCDDYNKLSDVQHEEHRDHNIISHDVPTELGKSNKLTDDDKIITDNQVPSDVCNVIKHIQLRIYDDHAKMEHDCHKIIDVLNRQDHIHDETSNAQREIERGQANISHQNIIENDPSRLSFDNPRINNDQPVINNDPEKTKYDQIKISDDHKEMKNDQTNISYDHERIDRDQGYNELNVDGSRMSKRNTSRRKVNPCTGNENFAVFSTENCLDLHQIRELNPTCPIYFILYSDSPDIDIDNYRNSMDPEKDVTESMENNYSSEDLPESDQLMERTDVSYRFHAKMNNTDNFEEQCNFMNELHYQWDLMCCSTPKTTAKSQWMILDDTNFYEAEGRPLAPFLSKVIQKKEMETRSAFGDVRQKVGSQKEMDIEEVDRSERVDNKNVFLSKISKFMSDSVQKYLLQFSTALSEVHIKLLQQFILASFDMAREMQIVPKKIQYVAIQEQQLFDNINEKFSEGDKKAELLAIMNQVLQEMQTDINAMDWCVDNLPCHQEKRVVNSVFYARHETDTNQQLSINFTENNISDIEEAVSYDSYNFEDYDVITSNDISTARQYPYDTMSHSYDTCHETVTPEISLIKIENESESVSSSIIRFGTRILDQNSATKCTNSSQISIKQASLDVQKTVLNKLSRKISQKLVQFVDCLRETYFGTLQRCLESLELSCREELGGRPATEAMRQVLSVAKQVDLQSCASFSVLRTLIEHLRRFFQRLRVGSVGEGATACCVLSPVWRRQVALHTVHTLSPARLARIISTQILERLGVAHERYQAALTALEAALTGRLHHTEDVKLAIRKRYAPGFARLCLESTSMCDVLMHGTPELGREIGRGQYGVVFACRGGWGGYEPCAVKSVLPGDERHFNELAMEFFYTRSIPHHPRIVRLYGSVVERHASGSPTVLLISQRLCRDLYCAVRGSHLPFAKRMRISLDIVEGIRYLHSLGLVHRDIKMKNVLLDHEDRASLTDLGFCVPESLMSGSIVGTPVHMAPELLTGDYDSSVDVYAFGILFWYVCAGNTKLPSAFEMFQNKEQLWSKVRRGLRPERLPFFTDECWNLMESCWDSEPSKRALLGDVQPILERILDRSIREIDSGKDSYLKRNGSETSFTWSENSLNFTGVSRYDVV